MVLELSLPDDMSLSFLILVAGFNSKNLPMRAVPHNITTRTLLVIGEEDKIIPKGLSNFEFYYVNCSTHRIKIYHVQ